MKLNFKKRTSTKMLSLVSAALLMLPLSSCGKGNADYTIGICNYTDDASLNQIADNLRSHLQELATSAGVTLDIRYDNPNGDATVMNQIISGYVASGVDMMVGIATPVAMAMQAATEDTQIPVVFAAVSDPVSVGLVDSMETPGANLTGTSDYLDTNAMMNLIFQVDNDVRKVGLLYDQGQESSSSAISAAKTYLSQKGIEYVERTGTNNEEMILAAQTLVSDGVDAVFTPSDNTVMKSELAIYEIFQNAKIPHYGGADSFALNGAFLGYGVDYANLGRETAEMIFQILTEKQDVSEIAVKTFDNGTATINIDVCEVLGFSFDELSEKLSPYCMKVQAIQTSENFEE